MAHTLTLSKQFEETLALQYAHDNTIMVALFAWWVASCAVHPSAVQSKSSTLSLLCTVFLQKPKLNIRRVCDQILRYCGLPCVGFFVLSGRISDNRRPSSVTNDALDAISKTITITFESRDKHLTVHQKSVAWNAVLRIWNSAFWSEVPVLCIVTDMPVPRRLASSVKKKKSLLSTLASQPSSVYLMR